MYESISANEPSGGGAFRGLESLSLLNKLHKRFRIQALIIYKLKPEYVRPVCGLCIPEMCKYIP